MEYGYVMMQLPDEAIEVVIKQFSEESLAEREIEEVTLNIPSVQAKQISKEELIEEQGTEQLVQDVLEEKPIQIKTLEISIIYPTFYEFKSIKADVISKIKIPPYEDQLKLKYINLVRFQLLKPTSIEIKEVLSDLNIPETNVTRALKSVLERLPELKFEKPIEISIVDINTTQQSVDKTAQTLLNFVSVPRVVLSVNPSKIKMKSLPTECLARSIDVISSDVVIEDFDDPIEELFSSAGFKQVSERPIIILAERPEDKALEYIEFLKRILREIYRTRSRGLPAPTHTSTDFEDIKLDIKAGKSIYVIDIDKVKIENRDEIYLSDRIRELYSQNFEFIVLYGSKSSLNAVKKLWMLEITEGLSRLPRYIEVKLADKDLAFTLANLFWGKVEPLYLSKSISLDEYVLKLEEEFYDKIDRFAGDLTSALIIEPSKEDEEGLEGESLVHYGLKAFIVKYFVKIEKIPLDYIQTEFELGDIIIDIFVKHPKFGDIAVEVETLYGTTLPLLKLRKRIESRLKKGLKTWIVIPNPQFMIYLKEISALRNVYKRQYYDLIEFYTLDVKSNRLVSFDEVFRLFTNEI